MREPTKNDYTEDELLNLKNGNCWCGKPRKEFDKGMRIYCSKKHREDNTVHHSIIIKPH